MNVDIQSKIVEALRTVEPRLATVEFSPSTTVTELGIASVSLIEVGVLLEDTFGSGVNFENWLDSERTAGGDSAYSLGSLLNFIQQGTREA